MHATIGQDLLKWVSFTICCAWSTSFWLWIVNVLVASDYIEISTNDHRFSSFFLQTIDVGFKSSIPTLYSIIESFQITNSWVRCIDANENKVCEDFCDYSPFNIKIFILFSCTDALDQSFIFIRIVFIHFFIFYFLLLWFLFVDHHFFKLIRIVEDGYSTIVFSISRTCKMHTVKKGLQFPADLW